MTLSDNTAANLVLDVLTTDAVNARMESLGLKNVKILRKIGVGGESVAGKDPENKKFGLSGSLRLERWFSSWKKVRTRRNRECECFEGDD